ncbi:ABC transporter permease subunit [Candidatus Phytoplasma australiense]|uniref:D-methionine transport system permease protein metI n=1 Tax=Strawberry lethal yellows phytoplasma (CPA) str. NZSb11 TaxID=980422 RepID=R4RLI8_PHYAS|nr:ABC transporter permease subunit [Candidatus Phytoplasma australiense]AGL90200.1 D-methionine transport system permease protein metI [Strawberry lethal yellows phytoplasma (CPA) str. NZSb11]
MMFLKTSWNVIVYNEFGKYLFINAFLETIKMAFLSSLIAFFFGLFLGVYLYLLKIKNHHKRYWICNTLMNFLIATPFLLLIFLFIKFILYPFFHLSYGFWVGFISLLLILTPLFARHCEQVFLTVNPEIYQTSYSLGANDWQFVKCFLLKEARSDLILRAVSLFSTSLAYSSVLGIVGHEGIGEIAISRGYNGDSYLLESHGFNSLNLIIVCALVMFLLTQIVQLIGSFVANKLNKR